MDILFNVNEQTLTRKSEEEQPAEGSKNYLKCGFEFNTPDWTDLVKIARFRDEQGKEFTKYLGKGAYGECFVPFGVLRGDYFTVSIYGGDLITTNEVIVTLMRSGYQGRCNDGQQDIFVDIIEELDSKVDLTEYRRIDNRINDKLDQSSFPSCFDARMELWCQDLIDEINQL